MSERGSEPIYSTREGVLALQDAIEDFVVSLAERIDILQDVFSSGDLAKLSRYAAKLADESTELGYPDLTEVAGVIVQACAEEKVDASEAALLDLTELARRIRRAHRGSA